MVLGTVGVFNAGDPAIDAAPALAREAEHAIEPRLAACRGLNAALVLAGNLLALSTARTVLVAVASPTASKDALLDRQTLEAVASRLDANQTDGTVVVRLAESLSRTRQAKSVGRARDLRAAGAAFAPRISRFTVFATK
jgi:hypothetical protein